MNANGRAYNAHYVPCFELPSPDQGERPSL